jgi:hypothetical protein
MKTTAKPLQTNAFGKLNVNLKRDPKWDEAIQAKLEIAQKTLKNTEIVK